MNESLCIHCMFAPLAATEAAAREEHVEKEHAVNIGMCFILPLEQ